jgi:hypothetical protein
MLLILALNWGGFIAALVYSTRKDKPRPHD